MECECVICNNTFADDCPACAGRGHWDLTECVDAFVDRATWQALRLIRLARRGLWPVEGGATKQTKWFLAAFEFATAEEQAWRKKKKLEPLR
ncbi:MAG: hypothetical protein ACF8PN_06775 [Phycisphaerales bacterium]